MTCYVCNKEIVPREVDPENYDPKKVRAFVAYYQGKFVMRIDLPVYVGQEKYRHESCAPGTAKWMKIQKRRGRKRSRLLTYYLAKRDKEDSA